MPSLVFIDIIYMYNIFVQLNVDIDIHTHLHLQMHPHTKTNTYTTYRYTNTIVSPLHTTYPHHRGRGRTYLSARLLYFVITYYILFPFPHNIPPPPGRGGYHDHWGEGWVGGSGPYIYIYTYIFIYGHESLNAVIISHSPFFSSAFLLV